MVNKKNNVPYYIVGSLTTLALLASAVFAAAPYVQVQFLAPILAPIAALGLSAPLIAVCAAFSAVVIAFSAIVVNKNRTLSKKETQLANQSEEIKAKSEVIAKQETQLANQSEEIKAINETLSKKEAQLAKNVRKIKSQSKRVIDSYITGQPLREKRKANKAAVEGDMYLESLFENISGDGVAQARNDLLYEVSHNGKELVFAPELSAYLKASLEQEKPLMKMGIPFLEPAPKSGDEMAAGSGSNTSHTEQTKVAPKKTSGWLSSRQVLGAGIATFGFASLLAQYFSSVANNSTGVDDLHNDGFSISEAGILATFGFMGLAAQCFTGSIASALSFANKPINSVNDHNNPSNPGTMLDDKLNQTEKMLNLSHKRAEKHFGADPEESTWKGWFFSLFSSKDTTYNPESDSNVPLGFDCNKGKVGQNGSIQANETVKQNTSTSADVPEGAIVQTPVGQNESAFDNDRPTPLFGLQGIVLYHQPIAKSAPPSGP